MELGTANSLCHPHNLEENVKIKRAAPEGQPTSFYCMEWQGIELQGRTLTLATDDFASSG